MTINQYDSEALRQYRHKAAEIAELRREVGQKIGSLEPSEAKREFESLVVRTKELEEFRAQLRPMDRFMAKYNVTVNNNHTVSFVLPKGVSRYEMLSEAQAVVTDLDLVSPNQLKEWANDPTFQKCSEVPERIQIDGHVEGGDAQNRAAQESLVKSKGLTLPSLEDLAAAFVAHYVATGEPLFGWYNKSNGLGFVVRAAGGTLGFDSGGLYVCGIGNDSGYSNVAVAALVPRN